MSSQRMDLVVVLLAAGLWVVVAVSMFLVARPSPGPRASRADEEGGQDDLTRLLGAYDDVLRLVDRLPPVVFVPYSRTFLGRWVKAPRLRWRRLLRYFVVLHISRTLDTVSRKLAIGAVLSPDPGGHERALGRIEGFRRCLPSVPVRRLVAALLLLATLLGYVLVPALLNRQAEQLALAIVKNVPVTLDINNIPTRLENIAKAVREAGGESASPQPGTPTNPAATPTEPLRTRLQTVATRLQAVLSVLLVVWLAFYLAMWLPAHTYRFKRLIFNVHPWTTRGSQEDETGPEDDRAAFRTRVRESTAVEHAFLTAGVHALEDRVLEGVGERRIRERHLDLVPQAALALPLSITLAGFSIVVTSIYARERLAFLWPIGVLCLAVLLPAHVAARRAGRARRSRSWGAFGSSLLLTWTVVSAQEFFVLGFGPAITSLLSALPVSRVAWIVRTTRRRAQRDEVTNAEVSGRTTAMKEIGQLALVLAACVLGVTVFAVHAGPQKAAAPSCSAPSLSPSLTLDAESWRQVLDQGGGAGVLGDENVIALGDGCRGLVTVRGSGPSPPMKPAPSAIRPVWSPDGRYIAFAEGTEIGFDEPVDVWVVRSDGSGAHRLARNVSSSPLAWSPDGRHLALAGPWANYARGVHLVAIDSEGTRPLGKEMSDRQLSWSPDGSLIAFQSRGWIVTAGIDGSGQRSVGQGSDFAWAPVGNRLLFSDDDRRIWVASAAGGRVKIADGYSAGWAPDGQRIVFSNDDGIFLAGADGAQMQELVEGAEPSWSPDGRWILFKDGSSYSTIREDGSERHTLMEALQAKWSRDGSLIALATRDAVFVARPDGSKTVRLVDKSVDASSIDVDSIDFAPRDPGYRLVSADGRVVPMGHTVAYEQGRGVASASSPRHDAIGMATTPSGTGYWVAHLDGEVDAFGDARFLGSLPAGRRTITGIAATPSGAGYWLVSARGEVFGFGDARPLGSVASVRLRAPIVAMAATPSGGGYWLVSSLGDIFAFGDARHLGSSGPQTAVVAMASTRSGSGYWLVDADGRVSAFGDAEAYAAPSGLDPAIPRRSIVGIHPTLSGRGYWLAAADGSVIAFGDAPSFGPHDAPRPGKPGIRIVGIAR